MHLTFLSRPRGAVGIAALLCRSQTAGGGSIPRWCASKTQDRRPAERQRARTKKDEYINVVHIPCHIRAFWFEVSGDTADLSINGSLV